MKKSESKLLQVRVHPEDLKRLKHLSIEAEMPMSELIRQFIKRIVTDVKVPDETENKN